MEVLKIKNIISCAKRHPYIGSIIITLSLLIVLFIAGMVSVVAKINSRFTFFIAFFIVSLILIVFITKYKRWSYYGFHTLSKFNIKIERIHIFIPLFVLAIIPLGTGINPNLTMNNIIYIITYMILVSFVEETIFRGIILKLLSKKSLITAILGSSILFSIAHLMNTLQGNNLKSTIIQTLFALVIGIILAILVIKTNNIFLPISYHYINNVVSSLNINDETKLSLLLNYSMFVIAIVYAVYLYNLIIRNKENMK